VANFPPLKAYFLATIDDLIACHALRDPFLDVGGGCGDVGAHLAKRGWTGRVIDVSPAATALARQLLAAHPGVTVAQESLAQQEGRRFATVLALDVLEHLDDDLGALRVAATLQPPGGALIATVPTHQAREWRWDDELYGHLRRYEPDAFRALLDAAGYTVVEMWEVFFPIFWFMRRGFTTLRRPRPAPGAAWERTVRSVTVNAWEMGPLSRALAWTPLWRPLFALQRRYRPRIDRGCEIAVLARRR
jgi:SAM-dependent methyltransferase